MGSLIRCVMGVRTSEVRRGSADCRASRRLAQGRSARTRLARERQAAGRSRYGDLLEAGLQIYEFTEGLLHAKTITVDGHFALIGSANIDIRSFLLNFELALLVYDEDFASRVHFLQSGYIEQSVPVKFAEWKARGRWQVLVDNISKLMSPLL